MAENQCYNVNVMVLDCIFWLLNVRLTVDFNENGRIIIVALNYGELKSQ